ncbi:MAG: radical SAM protein [Anaerolineae bacterium]|nr:radical SAM protein [Anaerolineae bacterium]
MIEEISIQEASIPLQVFGSRSRSTLPTLLNAGKDSRFHNVGALIIKVTHRCNLDCLYCYENIAKGSDMSLDTFKLLSDKVLSSSKRRKIMFLFHGGEPTLMSDSWYSEAIEYASKRAEEYDKIPVFAMQSNILAISDSKIQLLRDLGIDLSVSLDGPSFLPNAMRQRADAAYKTYKRLIKAGVETGVLMTINHSNFNHFYKICQWLENDIGVKDFKANVISSVGRGRNLPELGAEQIFQAYHDILEYMIETQGQSVVEDNLSLELERFFAWPTERALMPQTLCRDRKCGAGERVVGVTPDGKLLPCGRFQWDDHDYFLGSLEDSLTPDTFAAFNQATDRFHSLVIV